MSQEERDLIRALSEFAFGARRQCAVSPFCTGSRVLLRPQSLNAFDDAFNLLDGGMGVAAGTFIKAAVAKHCSQCTATQVSAAMARRAVLQLNLACAASVSPCTLSKGTLWPWRADLGWSQVPRSRLQVHGILWKRSIGSFLSMLCS